MKRYIEEVLEMEKACYDYAALEACGVFSNKISIIHYLMLNLIHEHENGIGAWEMRLLLANCGVELSSATVGRYLKELDLKVLTQKQGNKGRCLTENGKRSLEKLNESVTAGLLHKDMQKAVKGTEYQDLIDIYTVRIGIENVSVRYCCKNATDEEIELIGQSAADYKRLAEGGSDFVDNSLGFHVLIAQGAHNAFMEKVLSMLIFEQTRIENMLEHLSTRGEGIQFSSHHYGIYEAIKNRDEERAAELMNEHFAAIMETMGKR